MLNKTIFEDGNGGQLVLRNNEILQTESLATLSYMLMFGGNIDSKTQKVNLLGELKNDWWGNDPNKNSKEWINSETEKTLQGIVISSASRFTIEQSVKNDVKILEQFGEADVLVAFPNIDQIRITITIKEPSSKNSERLILVWDATRNEIIEKNII